MGDGGDATTLESIGDWIAAVVAAVAWPFVALVALALLFWSQPGQLFLARLRLRKISGFGLNVELSEEAAGELRQSLEEVFASYRRRAAAEFDRLVHVHGVSELHDAVAEHVVDREVVAESADKGPADFRSTVYVPDPLFDDALYCLLDYYPKGKVRGRLFSIRYGVIGRAWRRNETQIEWSVSQTVAELVDKWGMTIREARDVQDSTSALVCVVLRDGGRQVGVLFISTKADCLKSDVDKGQLEDHPRVQALAEAVGLVSERMRERGPALRIFGR